MLSLAETKIGAASNKICYACLDYCDTIGDYTSAFEILYRLRKKTAQQDPQLQAPSISIEPMDTLVQRAVDFLKQQDPNYFVGVRKIRVIPSASYGYVESGEGKDPAVININLDRIKNETRAHMTGAPQNQLDVAIIQALVETIAHERGHVQSYNTEQGFVGGETPAEAEARKMLERYEQKRQV